ncbi:hypothetical protein [Amycolatopsis sp. VC5-11]|uniref:hypothetical protein n=1 Tax=Amycolatopsis sp. VC5-11 TaxID=3120156 RepID=UPI0030092F41
MISSEPAHRLELASRVRGRARAVLQKLLAGRGGAERGPASYHHTARSRHRLRNRGVTAAGASLRQAAATSLARAHAELLQQWADARRNAFCASAVNEARLRASQADAALLREQRHP